MSARRGECVKSHTREVLYEWRPLKHCGCGKTVSITYSECVCVCVFVWSLSYPHAKHMRRVILSCVTSLAVQYFSTLLYKQ